MTDNEIIKALECCKSENGNNCEDCPCQNITYKQGNGGCCNALMGYALDLINRQKAEIEFLLASEGLDKAEVDELKAELELKKAEVERLQEIVHLYSLQYGTVTAQSERIAQINNEAKKEFAKLLKEKHSQADILCPRRIISLTEKELDKLVEEG